MLKMLVTILRRTSFGSDTDGPDRKFGGFRDNQSGETFATARCIRSYVGSFVGPYVGSYSLRRLGWSLRSYAIRSDPVLQIDVPNRISGPSLRSCLSRQIHQPPTPSSRTSPHDCCTCTDKKPKKSYTEGVWRVKTPPPSNVFFSHNSWGSYGGGGQ